ncbi:hypothetical protein [Peribacillus sp. SI8-4]|uniref:hypothetical protein n=1 Tax=Peribacillus sp. SI8-4 TaxID=3048009 RepID=UPI0025577ECC|nr:hypothetical protein [Peribacillus sp. SI8-4]
MTWIIQVVQKIETPRIIHKVKELIQKYTTLILAIIIGLLLMYAVYITLTIKTLIEIDFNIVTMFINVIKVWTVVICFCLVFTRNKLKHGNYIFFYMNTSIKAYELVLGSLVHTYLFSILIMLFSFFPLLLAMVIKGMTINLSSLLLLLLTISFLFIFAMTVWMLANFLLMKYINKDKENLYGSSIALITILFGSISLGEKYLKNFLEEHLGFYFSLLLFLSFILLIIFRRISTGYLMSILKQKNESRLVRNYKSKSIFTNNEYSLQMNVEWINFTRNQIFKEQGLVFCILIGMATGTYFIFDANNFFLVFSFITQFGLKEILVMIPLTVGMHFKEYKIAIYNLNIQKNPYFTTRVIIIYIVNCFSYYLFLLLSYFLFGVEMGNLYGALFSIMFITMFSILVSFLIKIDDFNKIFIVIFLLACVNIFDFIIQQTFILEIYIQLVYTGFSIIIFLIIMGFYLRKPILI